MAKKTTATTGKKQSAKKTAPRARRNAAAADRATHYSKTRLDHASEIAEDYVELISQLIRRCGEARTVDIAEHLGVSHVTVTKTISRLQTEGLVRTAPYRSIFLTQQGQDLAKWSEERHALVVEFLVKIGVNPADAEHDAEGAEHHFSTATLDAMRRFVKNGQ